MMPMDTESNPNPAALTRRAALVEADGTSGPWSARKRWGEALDAGFFVVPDVLVRAQRTLGLDTVDFAVLCNVLMHWWRADELPYPRPSVIAKRIGVSQRTVQRRLQALQARGLVKRLPSERTKGGLTVRRIDPAGLVQQLQALSRQNLADRPRGLEIGSQPQTKSVKPKSAAATVGVQG
jgi:predicted transcriptional regulator